MKEIVERGLNELSKQLIKRHDELGMRASGEWAESVEVEVVQEGNKIIGRIKANPYTEQLVYGRRPGKFPPIAPIQEWINRKGIVSQLKEEQLAFLIARKIANEGTDYYQQGGTDLVDSVITDNALENIVESLGNVLTRSTVEKFVTNLK